MGQCISCRDQVVKSARVDVDINNKKTAERVSSTLPKSATKPEEVLMKDATQVTNETMLTEKTKSLSDKKKKNRV